MPAAKVAGSPRSFSGSGHKMSAPTTEEIQRILEENKAMLAAAVAKQNEGKVPPTPPQSTDTRNPGRSAGLRSARM
eukprot:SAG22_NODE_459_length_10228_cov_9.593642_5_plen_76_part_00